MMNIKRFSIVLLIGLTSSTLASCGSSSSGPLIPPDDSGGGSGSAPGTPQNVQVVAGDGDSSEVQNAVSWSVDPDATEYTVYWDNTAGVSESSSVVVPVLEGTGLIVHSDVDVLAGNTYYYRVQAGSAGGNSALSDEVSGTPQRSITGNQLNDVAWNGVDTLVAVGDSGVILTSPNGTADGWSDVSAISVPETLTGVTWESVNSQFLIVGAGSTVLTGNGSIWTEQDLSNLLGSRNLEDVTWLGNRYIAVGNNGTVITSNSDGTSWTLQDPGVNQGGSSFDGVASNSNQIVIVGTSGTILTSIDAVTWVEQQTPTNNDLNDITWDGNQFVVVGSNDTVLTSPDGSTWASQMPGTSNINFVAVTQWDTGVPANAVLAIVGSSGTLVVDPDANPGTIIRTGTTQQLGGMTWVDDGIAPAYFVIVGNDGTVMTLQYE